MAPAKTPAKPRSRRVLDTSGDLGHQEGTLTVTRKRYGSEPEEVLNQKIQVPAFEVPPAYISVRAKETINTGDYNSVSVEVSLSLPVLPEESEILRVYRRTSDIVESWLGREVDRATNPNFEQGI